MKGTLINKFTATFNMPPTCCIFSPGRINIIGEHTDYNDGFVLPAAIDKGVYVAIATRPDDVIKLYANEFNVCYETTINNLKKSETLWANYILGVVNEVKNAGYNLTGFNLYVMGNLPIGAGLSSSAAVACATVFAINNLFNLGITKINMVHIAQKAEHNYAGVMCGIMDQFASIMGKKNHCIKLDCKTLAYEHIPLNLEGYSIVLFNTNVKHALASSAYNTRRAECAQGVTWVKENVAQINSLRDVNETMLTNFVLPKNPLVYKRCLFVVQEIERLKTACTNLQNGDLLSLGKKMFETHKGLSEAYEVSCKELDFLVAQVITNKNVLGARMMGGGFGGCTINIIKTEAVNEIVQTLSIAYEKNMNLPFSSYITNTSNGTEEL